MIKRKIKIKKKCPICKGEMDRWEDKLYRCDHCGVSVDYKLGGSK
jgi:ribosomal protein L37AE/L43A